MEMITDLRFGHFCRKILDLVSVLEVLPAHGKRIKCPYSNGLADSVSHAPGSARLAISLTLEGTDGKFLLDESNY